MLLGVVMEERRMTESSEVRRETSASQSRPLGEGDPLREMVV